MAAPDDGYPEVWPTGGWPQAAEEDRVDAQLVLPGSRVLTLSLTS